MPTQSRGRLLKHDGQPPNPLETVNPFGIQGLGLWVRGSGFRIRGILGLGFSTTVWFISVEGLGLQGFHLSLCFLLGVFTLSIRQCTFSVYSVLILMRGHKLDKRRSV